jgi:cation diffusion facilitator CzcD-associated flavoprotein CzcO
VFQRTPNWCAPLHNSKIDAETQRRIKAGYPEMFRRCQETFACFLHTPDPRGTFEVTPEEREAFFEKLYAEARLRHLAGQFPRYPDRSESERRDLGLRRPGKIRQRVKDQKVADKLIPKNHGFGTRRVPLETGIRGLQPAQCPIGGHQRDADRTHHAEGHQDQADAEYEFDMIILRDWVRRHHRQLRPHRHQGPGRRKLKDSWAQGPRTYLGVMVDGFPNMLMLMGPHTALGNIPRSIEYNVDWVTGLLRHAGTGLTRVEATADGRGVWTDHVKALGVGLLSNEVNSWMTGINSNVEASRLVSSRATAAVLPPTAPDATR